MPTPPPPATVRFDGRILFLCRSAGLLRAQLDGADLTLQQALPLRDDISTDEITPVTVMMSYDQRLGAYPYVGLQLEGQLPVAQNRIRDGGFAVTVAGARYGKGSSRESSPLAEKSAGIRLIIAESFERIYRQNCDNLGIFTSCDFSLIPAIRAGQAISLEQLLAGRDAHSRAILRAGGLLQLSRQPPRRGAGQNASAPARALTLGEKIIARHRLEGDPELHSGQSLLLHADWRFSHDYFTGMAAHLMHQAFGAQPALQRPQQIVAFRDHLVLAAASPAHRRQNLLSGVQGLADAHQDFIQRYPVRAHGALADGSGAEGICHALMTERYALPGEVVIGTDSHTTHSGALGCLAFGAGSSAIANSWVSGAIHCKMPPQMRVELQGRLPAGVMAKDLILSLLQRPEVRSGQAVGALIEFCGAGASALSIDERATLCNMVAEIGGFAGIVAPDASTLEFLRQQGRPLAALPDWMHSDPDAGYALSLRIDCSRLSPMVARPGDPGNGVALETLAERVTLDIAYGGSCTAGKRADFDAYFAVLDWARRHGLQTAAHTRLYLQFASMAVRDYCLRQGYLPLFEQMATQLIMPGCGACANGGPGASERAGQVSVSAINRNFPGRSGPGQVWLASPYTVAASAIAGHLISFGQLQARHSQEGTPA